MKKITAIIAVALALLAGAFTTEAAQTFTEQGGTVWKEVTATQKKVAKVIAETLAQTASGNWIRLRIFVPANDGNEPVFMLEVMTRDPNTTFEIETTDAFRGGQTGWIGVVTEIPLRTNGQGITQFQATRLLSSGQYFRAVIF